MCGEITETENDYVVVYTCSCTWEHTHVKANPFVDPQVFVAAHLAGED